MKELINSKTLGKSGAEAGLLHKMLKCEYLKENDEYEQAKVQTSRRKRTPKKRGGECLCKSCQQ